ncbi:MAG: HupE/UreJ family protein, partial [Gammaproteobacteria bacterium]
MFAIFHGHAHGTELPEAVNPLAYGVGFVTATGLLHLTGILLGVLISWPLGERAVRLGGGLIVLGGGWFLMANTGALA